MNDHNIFQDPKKKLRGAFGTAEGQNPAFSCIRKALCAEVRAISPSTCMIVRCMAAWLQANVKPTAVKGKLKRVGSRTKACRKEANAGARQAKGMSKASKWDGGLGKLSLLLSLLGLQSESGRSFSRGSMWGGLLRGAWRGGGEPPSP